MSNHRLPPKTPSDLSKEEKDAYDVITIATAKYFGVDDKYKRPDGSFYGPFNPLLYTPGVCQPYCDLALSVAKIPGLSITARETLILAINSHYKCTYQIYVHERLALKNTSLTMDQINKIKAGEKPHGLDGSSSVAFDTTLELVTRPGPLRKETWDALVGELGKQGAMAVVHCPKERKLCRTFGQVLIEN